MSSDKKKSKEPDTQLNAEVPPGNRKVLDDLLAYYQAVFRLTPTLLLVAINDVRNKFDAGEMAATTLRRARKRGYCKEETYSYMLAALQREYDIRKDTPGFDFSQVPRPISLEKWPDELISELAVFPARDDDKNSLEVDECIEEMYSMISESKERHRLVASIGQGYLLRVLLEKLSFEQKRSIEYIVIRCMNSRCAEYLVKQKRLPRDYIEDMRRNIYSIGELEYPHCNPPILIAEWMWEPPVVGLTYSDRLYYGHWTPDSDRRFSVRSPIYCVKGDSTQFKEYYDFMLQEEIATDPCGAPQVWMYIPSRYDKEYIYQYPGSSDGQVIPFCDTAYLARVTGKDALSSGYLAIEGTWRSLGFDVVGEKRPPEDTSFLHF